MKKISILVPTYNEQENVINVVGRLEEILKNNLKNYDYEIVFIDNCSKDNTRNILKEVDPDAFMIVTTANEVFGEGFKSQFTNEV